MEYLLKFLLLGILFTTNTATSAQVYKSIDSKGRITYSDKVNKLTPQPPLFTSPKPTPLTLSSLTKGLSNFIAYTTSDASIIPYLDNPTNAQKTWMNKHLWRIFAFSPYFDSKLAWSPSAWIYKDAYAIYPTGNVTESMTLENASQYILKDRLGNALFIPYGCTNGTCPQYAADIGNPTYRSIWITQAKLKLALGYKGIHVDDVNLDWRISNGSGKTVLPIDPRTGSEMTLTNWRRYFAEFTEEIRRALPDAEIVHNSLWWVPDTDPFVSRQLQSANMINIERGVVDDGLTSGTGTFGFESLLAYVDRRHAHKTNVLYFAYGKTLIDCEYNLATYYLTSSGNDGTTCLYMNSPNNWWAGYDTILGEPLGGREKLVNGVFQRVFENGVVLVNQPNATSTFVKLPGKYKVLANSNSASISISYSQSAPIIGHKRPSPAKFFTTVFMQPKRGVVLLRQ